MPDVPHAITSLSLENFRNYRSLSLAVPSHPVVLRGVNGAGKTNILEAISLLSPGRGLRGSRLREMDAQAAGGAPWVVAADVRTHHESSFIGTGRDGEAAVEKRIIKINGEKVRGHARLAEVACIQWLTPSMDQVFVEGGSSRRKLLDRIVYGFVSEHAARVSAYELAMRERNRLLADRSLADPYWLSVLEQQMAEHAVAITLAREEVMQRLTTSLEEGVTHFPRALIRLEGVLETWLGQGASALEVEARFAERLTSLRGIDSARGRATEGPQRSDLIVIHRAKSMPAERCSTGEQKALLLSIVLAAARARASWCGVPPILLLDEVIAHLDVDKRAALFDLIRATQIQAWMTGTDAADFQGLEGFATILEIDGGTVKM
ncbi:MAG: DNA replication/repair protein RecF [Pseudomonadota bacterium]